MPGLADYQPAAHPCSLHALGSGVYRAIALAVHGRRDSHLPGVSQGCVVTSVAPVMLKGFAEVSVSHPRAEEEEPPDTRRFQCAGVLG